MPRQWPALAVVLAVLLLPACTRQQAAEMVGQTLYNTAQAACRHADSCTNLCADGTPWRHGPIRCP